MLIRAYRLSSSWSYFTEECERLKSAFSKLKYPKHLVDSTVKTFLNLRVADQSSLRSKSTTENTTRVVIPFKDQESANIVKTQFKDLNVKLQTIVQPEFAQEFPTSEPKPQLIDQQCDVYTFKYDQCYAGYVGYIEDITCLRVDMDLIFEWSTRYLTSERSSLVRYRVEHEKIKFISISKYVTFCLLYKHQWNTKSACFQMRDLLCNHNDGDIFTCEDNKLSPRVKIWSFRGKAHLVFHWCLYNK